MYCIILIANTQASALAFQEASSRASSGPWKNRPLPTSSACSCLPGLPGDEEMMICCFGLRSPFCLRGEAMEGLARWWAVLLQQEQLPSVAVAITVHLSNGREREPFPLGLFCSPRPFLFHFFCPVRPGASLPPLSPSDPRRWVGGLWKCSLSKNSDLRSLPSEQKYVFHNYVIPLEGVSCWLVSSC